MAMETLNINWGPVNSQDTEQLPTKAALEAVIVSWEFIGADLGVLAQLSLESREGLSAYTLGSFVAGLASVNFSMRDVRKLGAAIAAAAQQSSATPRRATRRSSGAAAPVVDKHKSKFGKSLLKLVKEFCDSISPSQINQLKVETEASAQALGSLSWRRSLSASAAAVGAKAHAIWSSPAGLASLSAAEEATQRPPGGEAAAETSGQISAAEEVAGLRSAAVPRALGAGAAAPAEDPVLSEIEEAPSAVDPPPQPSRGESPVALPRQAGEGSSASRSAAAGALVSSNTRSRRAATAGPPSPAAEAPAGCAIAAMGATQREPPVARAVVRPSGSAVSSLPALPQVGSARPSGALAAHDHQLPSGTGNAEERPRRVLCEGEGGRAGRGAPPLARHIETAANRSANTSPSSPASPVASGRNQRGAASPPSGARSRPPSPRPARGRAPREGEGGRAGRGTPPLARHIESITRLSPNATPPRPASPIASGRNRRGAASPSSGARARPPSPRPARAPSPAPGGSAPLAAAGRSHPPACGAPGHQPPDTTAFVACALAESSDEVLDRRIAQLQQELEAAARARALVAVSAAGEGGAAPPVGRHRPQGPPMPTRSRSLPRAASRPQPPPRVEAAYRPPGEATLADEPMLDVDEGTARGPLRPTFAEMGAGEALTQWAEESGLAIRETSGGLHMTRAFSDQRCFVGLVPLGEHASSKQHILSCLSRTLGVEDGIIAKALREVARPVAASRALQLLTLEGSAQEAEAADRDYRQLVSNCGEQLPASLFANPPPSWHEATHRLYHVLQLAEGLLNGAGGGAGAPAPASTTQPVDDKRSHRRRLPSVARTSDQAKWATPARHIDKLDTKEIFDEEVASIASRHTRDIWQETQRIVSRYGGLGWSAVFSSTHVIEKSANDCRVLLTFPAASEGLYEKVYDFIIETCVGPSYRFKDELDKDVRRVCNGVIQGDFSLDSNVRVLGAIPSSEECSEAGRVAGDPNMGRAGKTSGPELQTDMPRALARFGDLLLMVHHFAGDCPPPPPGGLGLLELWYASAILPLESTKMPDRITEIVGQKRLQEVALSSISRAMQERRRSASDEPIDFVAIVRGVHDHEFKLARERQMQYSFAMAVSGKRDRDSDTRDQKADRPQQQSTCRSRSAGCPVLRRRSFFGLQLPS